MIKPIWVAVIMVAVCVIAYLGLSYLATESFMQDGIEEGGIEGIFMILTSASIGSSVYLYPVIALYFVVVIGYAIVYYSREKHKNYRRP